MYSLMEQSEGLELHIFKAPKAVFSVKNSKYDPALQSLCKTLQLQDCNKKVDISKTKEEVNGTSAFFGKFVCQECLKHLNKHSVQLTIQFG